MCVFVHSCVHYIQQISPPSVQAHIISCEPSCERLDAAITHFISNDSSRTKIWTQLNVRAPCPQRHKVTTEQELSHFCVSLVSFCGHFLSFSRHFELGVQYVLLTETLSDIMVKDALSCCGSWRLPPPPLLILTISAPNMLRYEASD